MRYAVVPRREGHAVTGFAIWDGKLSPLAVEADTHPVFCSLDGENELIFPRIGDGYLWLARCERAGLDLEADGGGLARVYVGPDDHAAELRVNDDITSGPVIRELPALWLGD